MKNQLIPLTRSSKSPDIFEPALVFEGFQYRQLVKGPTLDGTPGEYYTKHDYQGFDWVRDAKGTVMRCGGMPIIRLDDAGIFAIKNSDQFLLACCGK